MAAFSPWRASSLLAGAGQRLVAAGAAVAGLWLAVLWASLGTAPPMPASAPLSAVPLAAALDAPAPAPAPKPPSLRPVAVGGAPAPGGGSFDRFGLEQQTVAAPVNAGGDVAFFAKLMRTTADEGIFLAHDGRPVLVAATGGAAPGGGTFTSFTERPSLSLNTAGTVTFAVTIEGGRGSEAVLAWSNGRLTAIAQSGARAPGVTGAAFFDFGPSAVNEAGDVAFLATLRRGREPLDAVFANLKGQLGKVAAAGDAVPGGGVFAGFGPPAINGRGAIAFAALVEGGSAPGGIFIAEAGAIRRVVAAGDPLPGGGVFSRLSERVALDDAGRLAFGAFLSQGGPRTGVFLADAGGAVTAAAELGGQAPGGGRFAGFGDSPALAPDGRLAFIASVDGGSGTTGVYTVAASGALVRVAGPGDPVGEDGKRLGAFPLNPSIAAGPGGRVSFHGGLVAGEERADAIVSLVP